MLGFKGQRYQRGAGLGNILKGLFRMIVPLAKSAGKAVLPLAKSAGEAVAKQALETGKDVASDLLQGQNLGDTLSAHGKEAAVNLIDKASKRLVVKYRRAKDWVLGSRKV